ncbi:AzlD domain-containing protein [Faecalibacillus intestinalis]
MNSYVLSAIILSALITFLLRAFPFLLFKEKELPKWLETRRNIL